LRIAGVSPRVTSHVWAPVLRSIATSVPYGGLLIGSDGMRPPLSAAGISTRSD
jgi:hypothetical protein